MFREADVLRLTAEHRALVNDIVRTQRSESLHAGVSANFGAFADFSIGLDHRVRQYGNTGSNPGRFAYQRRRMNAHRLDVHAMAAAAGSRNWMSYNCLYSPPFTINSSCEPDSTTRPSSSTNILSA